MHLFDPRFTDPCGCKGPQKVRTLTFHPKQGYLWGQNRLLRVCIKLDLKNLQGWRLHSFSVQLEIYSY